MVDHGNDAASVGAADPLADPVSEAKRVVEAARRAGLLVRVLGGVAVRMQAPSETPLLPRSIGDIDLAIRQGGWRALADFQVVGVRIRRHVQRAERGAPPALFDHANNRKMDVFVGEFEMCHSIPITGRMDKHPVTIPLAELLLTKLQIVQLTDRDLRDIYSLLYHHSVSVGDGSEIEADFIADLCAKDWGLWRTCTSTIEQSLTRLPEYGLSPEASELIAGRLTAVLKQIEQAPKSARWKLRGRVGDRVRWYEEPEETTPTA